MQLEWSPRAQRDLQTIHDYIGSRFTFPRLEIHPASRLNSSVTANLSLDGAA